MCIVDFDIGICLFCPPNPNKKVPRNEHPVNVSLTPCPLRRSTAASTSTNTCSAHKISEAEIRELWCCRKDHDGDDVRVFAPCKLHLECDTREWIEENPEEWNRVLWEGLEVERTRMKRRIVPRRAFCRRYGGVERRMGEEGAGEGLVVEMGLEGGIEGSSIKEVREARANDEGRKAVKRLSSVSKSDHRLSGDTLVGLKEISACDTSIAI